MKRTDPETRELMTQEAQRRLSAGEPTRRDELADRYGTTARVAQDAIAVARDRNQAVTRAAAAVTGASGWREFENAVIREARVVPTMALDNLLSRLASLRRARS